MEKILVYDCSLFGQLLCKYLEKELPVQAEQIVDKIEIQDMSDREICERVVKKIKPYIGKVIGVIIANPLIVTVVAGELEKIFPRQKFIYCGKNILSEIDGTGRVAIFATDRVKRTERYQMLKASCQEMQIDEYDCDEWLKMLDKGWLGQDEIMKEFRHKLGMKLVIYYQPMLVRESKLEEVVDWRGEVIDMKKKILLPLQQMIKHG